MAALPGSTPGGAYTVVVALVLFALAAGLLLGPSEYASPVPMATITPAWVTDMTPVRQALLEPKVAFSGFSFSCAECHNLFPSSRTATKSSLRHPDIHLKHGINTHCFNCHNIDNRNTFVDDIGGEIAFDSPELLCARCHGPVYRDWQHGAHGRTNGYWDTNKGEMTRLKCIECHDPHQPPFPPMEPAQAPNTLRMGVRSPVGHPPERNPLRVQDAPGIVGNPANERSDGPGLAKGQP